MNNIEKIDISKVIKYYIENNPKLLYTLLFQFEIYITEDKAIALYDKYMDIDDITIFNEFFYLK